MEEQSPNTGTTSQKRSRGKGGLHRVPLSQAIEIAKAVYEIGQGSPVARAITLSHLKRSPTSGRSLQLIGASNTYELTRSNNDYLELTELGFAIVDSNSSEKARHEAVYNALFSNDEFEQYVSSYRNKIMPTNDTFAIDQIQKNFGLAQKDAEEFWNATKQNL